MRIVCDPNALRMTRIQKMKMKKRREPPHPSPRAIIHTDRIGLFRNELKGDGFQLMLDAADSSALHGVQSSYLAHNAADLVHIPFVVKRTFIEMADVAGGGDSLHRSSSMPLFEAPRTPTFDFDNCP